MVVKVSKSRKRICDYRKMILRLLFAVFAGFDGFFDNLEKVTPFGVLEQFLQVSGKPELYAILFVGGSFKSNAILLDFVCVHDIGCGGDE
jgi:hypothetical protein